MTPEEKVRQMQKVADYLYEYIPNNPRFEAIFDKLRRTKVFPFFMFSKEIDIPHMGKWTIVYEAESKGHVRKGVINTFAFQTFYVPRAKDPLNIGTGIYLYNPDDYGQVRMSEMPPHYFNRLRQRLIQPKGIVQPDFMGLVKEMFKLHHLSMDVTIKGFRVKKWPDDTYSIESDHSIDKKEGYVNLISFHKAGISLGISAAERKYFHMTTFVPNYKLRENQKDLQDKMMAEMREHEHNLRYNPLAQRDGTQFMDIDDL